MNTSRKENKIMEMKQAIQAQVDYIKELRDLKHLKVVPFQKSLFNMNNSLHMKRVVFGHMRERFDRYKRMQRLTNQTDKVNREKALKKVFYVLRDYSHRRFVKKLAGAEHEFREELESKILVQYRTKVD